MCIADYCGIMSAIFGIVSMHVEKLPCLNIGHRMATGTFTIGCEERVRERSLSGFIQVYRATFLETAPISY